MEISFSIIIPLYNKAPYIERAVKSVLSQDYPHFEIIIVNDGSSDGGEKIVTKIVDERLKLVSQKNAGVSAARNTGAEEAQYEYLAFLDGDDTYEPNFLSEIVKLIGNFPNAGIYGTSNSFIYPNGKKVAEDFRYLFNGKEQGLLEDYFGLFAQIQKSPFSNSNLCIPKKIYQEFGGYKVGVKLTEDSDLWCRIALKYDVAFSVNALANYFVALEGSTHTIFENKDFEVVNTLQSALDNKNVPQRLEKSVKKLIALQKLGLIKRGILTSNKGKILKNFLNFSILKYYTFEYIKCVLAFLLPHSVFQKIK
jgi:glycosyltransferase involved in cell wall biosynthesis